MFTPCPRQYINYLVNFNFHNFSAIVADNAIYHGGLQKWERHYEGKEFDL